MAILAVSPCADVLSIDAVRASWKRADRGITEPPEPSQAYALPLRFVWLIMGVIYFSAGFWKVWTAGIAWGWSDNPRNLMYNKWMELSGWTPVFRIDHYPLSLQDLGRVHTSIRALIHLLDLLSVSAFPGSAGRTCLPQHDESVHEDLICRITGLLCCIRRLAKAFSLCWTQTVQEGHVHCL